MNLIPIEQKLDNGLTVRGLKTSQRDLPLMVFLHGNGFAGGVYMPMHEILAQHVDLLMFDIPGHGKSDTPQSFIGWNNTAELLYEAVQKTGLTNNRPVYGAGHSLGGAFSILTAHSHPDAFQSLVLIDPIMFSKKLLLMLKVLRRLRLLSVFHPHIKSTLRRRRHWPDRQSAYNYFHGRKIYKHWTDAAVQSYVDHALTDDSADGVSLSCTPETESGFFASLPDGYWNAISNLQCETKIIMGEASYPFSRRAAITARKQNQYIDFKLVPGSHCFMQEDPQNTAHEILSAIGIQSTLQSLAEDSLV